MRKLVIRCVVIAIGVELIYLALINVLLNTAIGPSLFNQKPEQFQLHWDRVWSLVPGQFSANGVRIRAQTQRIQWYLEADQGDLWIRWWKLPLKYFDASSITAQGLSLLVRRRLSSEAERIQPPFTPNIPGLKNPPQVSLEKLYPDEGRPWHINLEDFSFRGLQETWVQQLRLTGEGKGRIGHLSTVTRGGLNVLEDTVLEFSNVTAQLGNQIVARDMQIEIEPTLDPVVVRGASFEQIAEHVSGSISIAGLINNLDMLNNLYQGMPIHVSSESEISLTANLKLRFGKLAPQSELLASANGLAAKYLHYTVKGKGTLRGEVSENADRTLTSLTMTFDDFALADDQNEPYLKDRGFELVTTAHDVGILDSGRHLKVVATLPESFIPDLTHYNDYIPSSLGIELEQGSGRLLSQFEFAKDEETIAGEIKMALTDVLAKYETVTVSGHVDVHTVVRSGNLKTDHYDAAGTRFELSDISVSEDGTEITSDWWSKITLGKTKLAFKPVPELDGDIVIRMSDSKPILAIFEEQEDLPSWIKDELNLENLKAEAALVLSNRILNVTDFELNSGDWTLLGDLIIKPSGREGILYIKHGKLGLAIERIGEQKKVKLLYGQEWFNKKREEFRTAQGLE